MSRDAAEQPNRAETAPEFLVRAMEVAEAPPVAEMHAEFFGRHERHGRSIASFGTDFLERVFYRANLDNPYLHMDVAFYGGELIGFSVYASDRRRVFRHTLRHHAGVVVGELTRLGFRHPLKVAGHVLGNLQFLSERLPDAVKDIPAWYFLLGVLGPYRTREFRDRTGIWVAGALWRQMEDTFRALGCPEYWGVVGEHNDPMHGLFAKHDTVEVARGVIQGVPSIYYTKSLRADAADR